MHPPLNVVYQKEDRLCNKISINNHRNKIVLEEEEYVSILSSIIERDYFPNLNTLNTSNSLKNTQNISEDKLKQLSIDIFLNDYTSYDNDSFEDLQNKSMEEHRKKYHWLYEQDGMKNGMLMLYYIGDKILTVDERAKMDYILNNGLYGKSDDNKMIGDDRKNHVDPWKFRVRNQLMFPPELKDSEDTCGMNDFRQDNDIVDNVPNTANIVVNKFKSILPVLSDHNKLLLENGRHNVQNAIQYAIATYNKRISMDPCSSMSNNRNEKIIQRHNTSFYSLLPTTQIVQEQKRNTKLLGRLNNILRLEEPHTPSLVSSTSCTTSDIDNSEFYPYHHRSNHQRQKDYQIIAMTPIIEPGNSSPSNKNVSAIRALSPIFTWGNLENSPVILVNDQIQSNSYQNKDRHQEYLKNLQSQAYLDNQNGMPFFIVNSHSKRELLARNLDSKHNSKAFKRKKSIYMDDNGINIHNNDNESQLSIKKSYYNASKINTNNKYQNFNNNSNKTILSSAQRFQNLTPAAKSLALKLNKK